MNDVKEVAQDEKIIGYDKDNLAEYRAMQEAEEILAKVGKDGFKQPTHKEIDDLKQTVHEYRRKKAQAFLEEHKTRIQYYGVEIKAFFDEDFFKQTGLIKPSLTIADFNPFKEIPKTKPWSEALEDNLAARINCTHELNDDETACKKCALNPENWGGSNEGVTDEYQVKQRARITDEKAKEVACENGEHVADENEVCKNCRKPKEQWGK